MSASDPRERRWAIVSPDGEVASTGVGHGPVGELPGGWRVIPLGEHLAMSVSDPRERATPPDVVWVLEQRGGIVLDADRDRERLHRRMEKGTGDHLRAFVAPPDPTERTARVAALRWVLAACVEVRDEPMLATLRRMLTELTETINPTTNG